MRKYVAGVITVALLSFASVASAQQAAGTGLEPSSADGAAVWGSIAWHGVGAGVRWSLPVADGVIQGNTNVYDQFVLDVGGDAYLDWVWAPLAIRPAAGFMWVFWLNDGKLGLYPKIDVALLITPISGFNAWGWGTGFVHWDGGGAVGAFLKSGSNMFRVEAGGGYWGPYYSGYLSAGITF